MFVRYVFTLGAVGSAVVAASGLVAGLDACTPTQGTCTPADQGLGAERFLTIRTLGNAAEAPAECEESLVVIATEDELSSALAADGVIAPDGGAVPAVDFGRERVVRRTGDGSLGVGWVVGSETTAYLGLQRCATGGAVGACATAFFAVSSAAVTRAESRVCQDVACGSPPNVTSGGSR